MTRGPFLLESFAASIRQDEARPGVTRVTYRFNFTTRPAWLRPILEPIAASLFLREVRSRLVSLKQHVERSRGR